MNFINVIRKKPNINEICNNPYDDSEIMAKAVELIELIFIKKSFWFSF